MHDEYPTMKKEGAHRELAAIMFTDVVGYATLVQNDEALAWLGRAYRDKSSWLAWAKVEPRFDLLRSDERFKALIKKMKLS